MAPLPDPSVDASAGAGLSGSDPEALVREVRAHVAWARAALGPLAVSDEMPRQTPAPRSASVAAPRGGSVGGSSSREGAERELRPNESGLRARSAAAGGPQAGKASPSAPPVDLADRAAALADAANVVAECKRCRLCETRNRTVFGVGSPAARLLIVGEAPGAEEDRTGEPFVGRAGQLLDKMLAAIGLGRDQVYIANLLKCRPPGNRTPQLDEIGACSGYLAEQMRVLDPELILALGAPAARTLLATQRGIGSLRGRFMRTPDGRRVMPTYHPAYLLRTPSAKRQAWDDLKKVAAALEIELPPRG